MTEIDRKTRRQVADIIITLERAIRFHHTDIALYVTESFEMMLKLARDCAGGYLYQDPDKTEKPPTFMGVPVYSVLGDRLGCPQEEPYRVVVEL